MTVKEFLYEEWVKSRKTDVKAVCAFYDKYIPSCCSSDIENDFSDALVNEGQCAFYAGMEAFRRIMLEFGLYRAIDISKEN